MTIKKLDKAAFDNWVAACIENQRVFGVQAKDDRFVFAPLENAEDLRLDYDVTILPPKKYFLPPRETLLKFERKEGFESVFDDPMYVNVGPAVLDSELDFHLRADSPALTAGVDKDGDPTFAGSQGPAE